MNDIVTSNTAEIRLALEKEVQAEFTTSSQEVYKAAIRSLFVQEQKLDKQIASVNADKNQIAEARKLLAEAFEKGELVSAEDAQGIVRTVAGK